MENPQYSIYTNFVCILGRATGQGRAVLSQACIGILFLPSGLTQESGGRDRPALPCSLPMKNFEHIKKLKKFYSEYL